MTSREEVAKKLRRIEEDVDYENSVYGNRYHNWHKG